MSNRITIPFKVYNHSTGVLDDWSVRFLDGPVDSASDIQSAAKLLTWEDISYEFNHDTFEFSVPATSMTFFDAISDSNNMPLIEFLASTFGIPLIDAYIYKANTIIYKFKVQLQGIKWSTSSFKLTVPMTLLTYRTNDFNLRDVDGPKNWMNITEDTGGSPTGDYLLVDMIDSCFSLLIQGPGESPLGIDHVDVDLNLRNGPGPTVNEYHQIDEVYLSDKLRDCLHGTLDSFDIYKSIKTIGDFMRESCKAFQLMYGIDEESKTFIVRTFKMYVSPTEINAADVMEIEVHNQIVYTRFACEALDGLGDRGDVDAVDVGVTRDEDGHILTTDYKNCTPKLWFGGFASGAGIAGDFRVPNNDDSQILEFKEIKFQGITGGWVEFTDYSANSDFIIYENLNANIQTFYPMTVRARGVGYNVWSVYWLYVPLANGGTIRVRLYPRKIEKNIMKNETKITGLTIKTPY